MRRILLVAEREFLQLIRTRAFLLTLLLVPAMLAITVVATRHLRTPPTVAYILVDAGSGNAAAIERRFELAHQRQVLRELSAYAGRWRLPSPGDAWGAEANIENFIRYGGAEGALKRLQPPEGVPDFTPPPRPYIRVQVPEDVPTARGAEAFGSAIAPYLAGDIETPEGKRPLTVAAWLSGDGTARIWTNGRNAAPLVDIIQNERNRSARTNALAARGLDPQSAGQIASLEAPVAVTAPPAGGGRQQMLARNLAPLGLVYLLLMASLVTGGMMLQAVIEERSNKLLEAILACVEPRELMLGKLIGLGGAGLTIIIAWIGCAILAALAIEGAMTSYVTPPGSALTQPWMLPLMAFYFFCGYLILAMVYLVIGSLSSSMQDAQAYLVPITMAILLPVMLLVTTIMNNPGSWLPQAMSWIPVYTPFAMLARLGGGVPAWEIAATGVLLVAFVVLEIVLLGRVFRATLLGSGQPKGLRGFVRLMLRRD